MTSKPAQLKAVKAYYERLFAAGGSRKTFNLSPEATLALQDLCKDQGLSPTKIIHRLILGANKNER